jgi:hypothetical protein
MQASCRIERVTPPTFDQASGTATAGGRTLIYEGPCRLWEVSGGAPVVVGEDDIVMQSTQLSIPWDVPVVPKKDDEVVITAHPTDQYVVGKRFVIDSSAKAGDLRATRRFAVRGYQRT